MVSPHPLQGAFDRVHRAEEHLAEFEAIQRDFGQANHDAIIVKYKAQEPHNLEPEIHLVAPPIRAAILVGEIIYNLRAALDYLIYELALKDSGAVQEGTQFPICDAKGRFDGIAPKFLVGLNAKHWAAIEGLQPYNGCNWMGYLRDISNPDKHRRLTAHTPGFQINASTYPKPNLKGITAPKFRSVRRAMHPVSEREMDVYLASEFPIMIPVKAPKGRPDHLPVIKLAEQIQAGVRDTLTAFKPEF